MECGLISAKINILNPCPMSRHFWLGDQVWSSLHFSVSNCSDCKDANLTMQSVVFTCFTLMVVCQPATVDRGAPGSPLIFSCLRCICSTRRLYIGIIDTMDCTNTDLLVLPASPVALFVEVCDMTGTPYCELAGNEDHESADPRYGLIVCETGKLKLFN